jgi:hypothetical protein
VLILKRSKTHYKMKIKRKLSFLMSGKTVGSAPTSSMGIARMTHQLPATTPLATLPIEVHGFGETQSRAAVGQASITVTP